MKRRLSLRNQRPEAQQQVAAPARFSGAAKPQARPITERPITKPSVTEVLDIEKVVVGGRGLARTPAGVTLVSGALPGEQVEASVVVGKGVREGVVLRLLRPSPQRVEATQLPTADLTHADYPLQLDIKRELVGDALRRIGRSELRVAPTVPSPLQWHYRNGAQYLITPQGLAYRSRHSRTPWLLTEQGDPLVLPAINAVLAYLRGPRLEVLTPATELTMRASEKSGEVVITLIGEGAPKQYLRAADMLMEGTFEGGVQVVGVSLARPADKRFSAGVKLIAGEPTVTEQLGDVQLSLSASGFAQVNAQAAGAAYQEIARLVIDGLSTEQARELLVTDLYGGSGAIARHLLGKVGRVDVIDTSSEALKRGQSDMQRFERHAEHVGRVQFIKGDASTLSPESGVIVVDPPRAGLSEQTREALNGSAARRLVYLSCDPATWARDVAALQTAGWSLQSATPYDFYPQTSHVEVLSVFERSQ